MKAVWQDAVLAESDQTVVVEGNHYFPPQSVDKKYFEPSQTHSTCAWKGTASYYHVRVGDQNNSDAAWYYPQPKEAAQVDHRVHRVLARGEGHRLTTLGCSRTYLP